MSSRSDNLPQLDSVRGFASLVVLISHYSVLFPENRELLLRTPFIFLFSAGTAVSLFFSLSGFVLGLSLMKNPSGGYAVYLIRRLCRIYLPYIFSLGFALLCLKAFKTTNDINLGPWFAKIWPLDLDVSQILAHFIFLGRYDSGVINPVYWSLVIEFRVAILLPVIVALISSNEKHSWWMLLVSLGLGACSKSPLGQSLLLDTFIYVPNFIFGVLAAKCFLQQSRTVSLRYFWIACLFTLFSEPLLLALGIRSQTINSLLTGLSSAVMILHLANYPPKVLTNGLPAYLGRISFSVYLLHCVVLLSLINLYDNVLSNVAILWVAIILTLILSDLCYRFVEVPSITLGRILAKAFKYSIFDSKPVNS